MFSQLFLNDCLVCVQVAASHHTANKGHWKAHSYFKLAPHATSAAKQLLGACN